LTSAFEIAVDKMQQTTFIFQLINNI